MAPGGQRVGGFAARALVNLLTAAAVGILALVNEILAARVLGPEGYGLFALAVIFARAAQIVAQFGLDVAIYRQLPIDLAAGETARARRAALTALTASALLGALLAGAVAAAAGLIADDALAKPDLAAFLRLAVVAVPGLAIMEISASALRAAGGLWSPAVPLIGARAAFTLGVVVLAWLGLGGAAVAVVYAAASVLPLIAGFWLAARLLPGPRQVLLSTAETRALLLGAAPMLAGAIVYQVLLWADVVIVGWFRPAAEVGVYRACLPFVLLIELALLCWNVAAARVYPVFAEARDRVAAAAHYELSNRIVLFLTAPYVAALIARPDLPLRLMGPEFTEGATVLAILAGGLFVKCGLGSAAFALIFSGHQKTELAAAVGAAVTSITLNLILVPIAGITGAAMATASAIVLLAVARIALLRRRLGIATAWRAPAAAALAVAVGATAARLAADLSCAACGEPARALLAIGAAVGLSVATILVLGLRRADYVELWSGLAALRRGAAG